MKTTYQIHELNQDKPANKAVSFRTYKMMGTRNIRLLWALLYHSKKPYGCRPGQELLGNQAGYSRQTANKGYQQIRATGAIDWIDDHRKAHQYLFPDMFFTLLCLKKMGIRVVFAIVALGASAEPPFTPLEELIHSDLYLSKNQSSPSTSYLKSSSFVAAMTIAPTKFNRLANGQTIYDVDTGEANPKRTQKEFEEMISHKKGLSMKEKLLQDICDQIQLSDDDVDTIGRCSDDVIKRVHKNINAAIKSNRPSAYFMKMVDNAIKEVPKQQGQRFVNKDQAPPRHIDQALLQPLSEEAKKKRADEKRQEWESRRGKKKHDAFYVETKEARPVDQPDKWYTPEWCQQRLDEDLKILHWASKMDASNDYLRYTLPIVKERVAKCEEVLAKYKQVPNPAQRSLFEENEPANSLDYDQLDEIF